MFVCDEKWHIEASITRYRAAADEERCKMSYSLSVLLSIFIDNLSNLHDHIRVNRVGISDFVAQYYCLFLEPQALQAAKSIIGGST